MASLFGELNILWQKKCAIGQILIVVNGKIIANIFAKQYALWANFHCSKCQKIWDTPSGHTDNDDDDDSDDGMEEWDEWKFVLELDQFLLLFPLSIINIPNPFFAGEEIFWAHCVVQIF